MDTPYHEGDVQIGHGSVLIAAITSCTNTSNPSVMLAAGLLAKKAVERGMRVDPGGEDFTWAGFESRRRLSRENASAKIPGSARIQHRRLRLHDLHRQFRAAAPEDRGGHFRARPRGGERPFRKPEFRSARAPVDQGEFPRCRRRSSSPLRSPAKSISIWPMNPRQGSRRQGRLPARHLADARRGQKGNGFGALAGNISQTLFRFRGPEPDVE